ncbi:hypothetical protein J7E88_17740 [Streptomyces sp. ISL-10]|nr:hypothetical protein [Streptomyces sp. ISL-10]
MTTAARTLPGAQPSRAGPAIARRFLGTSAAERLAAREERTEQLLERNRTTRELHDSIGHALTVAVVRAGAARAAMKRAALTDREAAVLRLLARGPADAEIAAQLVVGTETVRTQVSAVSAIPVSGTGRRRSSRRTGRIRPAGVSDARERCA